MRCAIALLALPLAAAGADRWRLQYFHDEDESSLSLVDLKFGSPARGVAVGFLSERRSSKPVCLVTSNGGADWVRHDLRDEPVSLFFLNESLGWMVTRKNIWVTEEGGLSWKKLNAPSGLLQVYFLDPNRGFAVGLRRQLYVTRDGGGHWEKLPAAAEIKSNADYTSFAALDFAGPHIGLIAGNTRPPRRHEGQEHPDWVDPEAAAGRRQWPSVVVLLETRDGGNKWTSSSASVFGRVSRTRLSPQGWGLVLLEYDDFFEYPSDVLLLNWKTGKNLSTYKSRNRRVTDVGIGGEKGPAYLAGVETSGKLTSALVPGKVKIMKSWNALSWEEEVVDYRAVARRVVLSVVDGDHAWAATDTGMILRLEHSP